MKIYRPIGPQSNRRLLQNRELQIMRIVRHPNIVQLKAFYYSNGERVSQEPLRRRHDGL